eukprot:6976252-Prymnesium_polylepis.1
MLMMYSIKSLTCQSASPQSSPAWRWVRLLDSMTAAREKRRECERGMPRLASHHGVDVLFGLNGVNSHLRRVAH